MKKTGRPKSDDRIVVETLMETHQAYRIIDMSEAGDLAIKPEKVRAIVKAIKEKDLKKRKKGKKECRKL